MDVFSRRLGYIRVPVLLKFNGDPSATSSSYFRIGPHFDLLNSAKYSYTNNNGLGVDQDVNLRSLYEVNPVTNQPTTDRYKTYKNLVVGLTIEMGGAVNLTEELKLLFMLHMSGSLTNPEDVDAGRVGTELSRSGYLLGVPVPNGNPNPFPSTQSGNRQTAYNVMGGFTVGFNYVLAFD